MPNRRAIKDPAFARQWASEHPYCQACGVPQERAPWPGLSNHHCVKRGRSDEACNLLRLCHRCHSLAELLNVRDPVNGDLYPTLTLAICLTIKTLREPAELDLDRLAYLRGFPLPDLEPLPRFLIEEWEARQRT